MGLNLLENEETEDIKPPYLQASFLNNDYNNVITLLQLPDFISWKKAGTLKSLKSSSRIPLGIFL